MNMPSSIYHLPSHQTHAQASIHAKEEAVNGTSFMRRSLGGGRVSISGSKVDRRQSKSGSRGDRPMSKSGSRVDRPMSRADSRRMSKSGSRVDRRMSKSGSRVDRKLSRPGKACPLFWRFLGAYSIRE